jgi:hypothetical protein
MQHKREMKVLWREIQQSSRLKSSCDEHYTFNKYKIYSIIINSIGEWDYCRSRSSLALQNNSLWSRIFPIDSHICCHYFKTIYYYYDSLSSVYQRTRLQNKPSRVEPITLLCIKKPKSATPSKTAYLLHSHVNIMPPMMRDPIIYHLPEPLKLHYSHLMMRYPKRNPRNPRGSELPLMWG